MSAERRFEGDLDFRADGTAWVWTGDEWVFFDRMTRSEWAQVLHEQVFGHERDEPLDWFRSKKDNGCACLDAATRMEE